MLAGHQDPKPDKKSDKVQRILALYSEGYTYDQIAPEIPCSQSYVQSIISTYAKDFQPIGRLNKRLPEMTLEEMNDRRRKMSWWLAEEGVAAWVSVMREHRFWITPRKREDMKRLIEIFRNDPIIRATPKYIIVKKEQV